MIQIDHRPVHAARLNQVVAQLDLANRRFRSEAPQLLRDGNSIDRMAGRDANGRALVPWRVRRGKYRGATGPTLAPFGLLSRSIRSFYAEWRGQVLAAGFRGPGVEILAYHALGRAGTGRKGQVTGIVRDVLGVSPQTIQALRDEFRITFREALARRAVAVGRRAASFAGSVVSLGGLIR